MTAGASRAFVTGGGGYVGSRLCKSLSSRGYSVTAFDVHYSDSGMTDGITRIQGDIRIREKLQSAVVQSKPHVVFHIASFGMSGREMLDTAKIEAVNITGTRNLIEVCVDSGVTCLVYTSTFNVVFGGQVIRNGDESLPYLPLHKHVDHYSSTKAMAEQEVLRANGRPVVGGAVLKTCALRCAGIYGEGEQRHLPRIVGYIEHGLFRFTYGAADALVEFLHIDNFVQAHIKAAEALTPPESPVAGQAYFISDNKPINNFEFFKPLVEGLGYNYPRLRLPVSLVYYIAFLIEVVHGVIGRYIYNFQPLLTKAEVFKTGITHYFSIEKARRDFDYDPEPRTLDGVVKWFREKGHGRRGRDGDEGPVRRSAIKSFLINLILVLTLLTVIMSFLPMAL